MPLSDCFIRWSLNVDVVTNIVIKQFWKMIGPTITKEWGKWYGKECYFQMRSHVILRSRHYFCRTTLVLTFFSNTRFLKHPLKHTVNSHTCYVKLRYCMLLYVMVALKSCWPQTGWFEAWEPWHTDSSAVACVPICDRFSRVTCVSERNWENHQ